MNINKNFFNCKAEIVAQELLGKILVRKFLDRELRGRIVETEAYYDENDPASRACQNGDLRLTMMMKAGTILVYGVHNSWLVNIVTGEEGKASAVLIRATEPLNFEGKCNGPGLLTKTLLIDKRFHKRNILDDREIWIENDIGSIGNLIYKNNEDSNISEESKDREFKFSKNKELLIINNNFETVESFRIGVKKDLPIKLRFYIKGNNYVSRR